jgi:hypothetical protein
MSDDGDADTGGWPNLGVQSVFHVDDSLVYEVMFVEVGYLCQNSPYMCDSHLRGWY